MLYYPKIPGSNVAPNGRCIAFEKYDGTNLHWDWDRDFGWHDFGTRRDSFPFLTEGIEAFQTKHTHLAETIEVFRETLAGSMISIFTEKDWYRTFQSFRIFTEFLGPNSFAGLHHQNDPKQLILFDVEAIGFGLIGPEQFVNDFEGVLSAKGIYRGKFTGQFAEDVRNGKYSVAEGVICKGGEGGEDLWMVKIKTYAYLEKLEQAFGERWEDYWE
jgi:hypothetical protein